MPRCELVSLLISSDTNDDTRVNLMDYHEAKNGPVDSGFRLHSEPADYRKTEGMEA